MRAAFESTLVALLLASEVLIGCGTSSGGPQAKPVAAASTGSAGQGRVEVSFDTSGAEFLLEWARCSATEAPQGWRSTRAFEAVRKWASANGLANPDERMRTEVDQVRRQGLTGATLTGASKILRALTEGRQEFLSRAARA